MTFVGLKVHEPLIHEPSGFNPEPAGLTGSKPVQLSKSSLFFSWKITVMEFELRLFIGYIPFSYIARYMYLYSYIVRNIRLYRSQLYSQIYLAMKLSYIATGDRALYAIQFFGFLADDIARNFRLYSSANWVIWSKTINKPHISDTKNASYSVRYFWLYSHIHLAIELINLGYMDVEYSYICTNGQTR